MNRRDSRVTAIMRPLPDIVDPVWLLGIPAVRAIVGAIDALDAAQRSK